MRNGGKGTLLCKIENLEELKYFGYFYMLEYYNKDDLIGYYWEIGELSDFPLTGREVEVEAFNPEFSGVQKIRGYELNNKLVVTYELV
ncbi:MAG: hypothetical protein R6U44_08895 [Archaeoglobaceae archaeon]